MLTGRNEWIAVGALIVWIALIETPPALKDFLGSTVGKAVALATVVYTWKSVSQLVAVLLVVVMVRSGAIREHADDPSIQPSSTPKCHCETGYEMDAATKQCKKGTETKPAQCCGLTQEWDGTKCKDKATPAMPPTMPPVGGPAGGPDGGSTGSAAAMAALASMPEMPVVTEGFTPYVKKNADFAPA